MISIKAKMDSPASALLIFALRFALSRGNGLGGDFSDFPSDYHHHYSPAHNESELYLPSVFAPELFDTEFLTDQIEQAIRRYRHYQLPVNNERFYRPKHTGEDSCVSGKFCLFFNNFYYFFLN